MIARPRTLHLLDEARRTGRPLHVSAPMVRYSKLPFRLLVRDYGVDVTYTPMILAHEFIRSQIARDSDFTTSSLERRTSVDGREHALIAQFASSDSTEFARAAEMIAPWVDGVDLNCGCPQSWAMKEGIGCSLMESPSLVADLVKAAKARLGPSKTVSVKIRISKDLAQTFAWVKTVEEAGVDYITVHGRTRSQRSSTAPDYEAIRRVKESTNVPVFANGDAYSLPDVRRIVELTGVDGVMAARGILEKPALFSSDNDLAIDSVKRFLEHAVRCPIPYPLVLHHVGEMTARMREMGKAERKRLIGCRDLIELIDYTQDRWNNGGNDRPCNR